ncbi:MAG: aminotransferase [Acidimicrobiia bacterium BACL6 MAG-120924-bin43]|jgi:arginine:pyruvate transaminase|uniref:Aminotransferase n=1 Tax=Acidimicrobiia bacterium BACL6 MAG-120924-bin43 TaxID=1655583 RepID=A0A0R2QHS4_9ACTN|nr:MAG: aminotransferase [Acidimicrobiia bacterium BACL6 MAG-120924-bin43]
MKFAPISDRLAGLGAAKWAVHSESLKRAALGQPIIILSIGEPDLPPPAKVLDQATKSMRSGRTRYAAGQGEPEALLAIANHLSKRSGNPVTPEQVLYTAGTQNGLCTALFTLVQAGDEVLVPDPYYATYEGLVAASGATFVSVPTSPDNGFHVTAQAIENAITPRTKVLLLNNPSNPTGAVLSVEEIDAIGEVCERHDLWIICDEVYADMTFDGTFCSPFDRPHLRHRTLSVSSISKSHALPGFRAGWVACPAEVTPRLVLVAEAMLFGSQPFIEDALAVALNETHPEVERMRAAYKERADVIVEAFKDSKLISTRLPEGGMFMMLDIRKTGLTGEQFAWRLLDEENVGTMPGESFGSGGAGHVRVALTVEAELLKEASIRIRRLADACLAK